MQELTLMLIRFAYLAILWIFVFGAISVIRSDMFGARVDAAAPTPSRRHAEFSLDGRQVKVADLGSTNGTLVDGHKVRETTVRDGAKVRLGNTEIVVRVGGA